MILPSLRFLFLSSLALATPVAAAPIVANFSDGNGTASSDQFVGTAGNGWTTAWTNVNTGSTGLGTRTVVSTSSLAAGTGNYLSVTTGTTTGTGDTAHFTRRSFDASVASQAHTISWLYRLDSFSDFSTFQDRLAFTADASPSNPGTAGTNTWNIGVNGGLSTNPAQSNVVVGNWFFFNRSGTDGSNFSGANMLDTGIPLVVGDVYSFLVDVDPVNGTYAATVTNLTTSATFSASNLVFRNGLTNVTPSTLYFGGNKSVPNESFVFSLDSVVVTPIPEPTTWAVMSLVAAGAFVARRRFLLTFAN